MEDRKLRIKSKIRALLSKTIENGASEHEAIQALKKANELMLENFIFEHDLQGIDPEKIIEIREPIVVTSYDYTVFYSSLARLFDCECFWTTGRRGDIVFYGFESDAKLAMYFYKMIMRSAATEVKRYKESFEFIHSKAFFGCHGKTLVASFVRGFSIRLSEKLWEMYIDRKSSIPKGMGLMVVEKDEQVQNSFRAKRTKLRTHKVNDLAVEQSAFIAGVERGEAIELVQPLKSASVVNNGLMLEI